jgi:photosystem II stability/assembly factor-like uncharacterized protein
MKKILFLIGLTLSIFNFENSFAQTPTWKNITPAGWSGDFKQIFYGKGNGLIALADNGYFYLSKDTAHTWTIYPQPDTAIIAAVMYPDNTNGFLYNQVTAYKTADGAKTWTKLPMTGIPTDMQIRTIWIKNADTVFAVVTNLVNGVRIFLSSDKGNTWTQVAQNIYNSASYVTIFSFYFPTPTVGFAYGYDLYVTTTDGGKTWVNHPFVYDGYAKSYTKTYSYPNGKTILFFDNQIQLSLNGDPNPAKVTQAGTTSDWVTDVVAFGANVSAIDKSGYLYYSVDSGATWNSKAILNRYTQNALESMYFFDKNNGVVVCGLLTSLVTTDGGTTWTKYVHAAADGFNKIYCKTKDECYITGNAGRLFHTIDGGSNWNYRDLQGGKLVEVEFPTKDTGYVSGGGVIFRTIDAGVNWTKFTQSTGGGFIDFPTKDTGFVGYSTGTPAIKKTMDAGKTWHWADDMTYDLNKTGGGGACFRSTIEGLVTGDNNLLYTNDGGNSWQNKAVGITGNEISATNDNGWVILSIYDSTVNSLQQGFIRMYKCDKDINCKKTITTANGGGLKKVNDSTLCFQSGDSIYFSKNYGNTWKSQLYWNGYEDLWFSTTQIAYSIGIGSIYKAWFASNLTITNIKENNNTLSITLSSIDGVSSTNTTIYLLNNVGDTVYSLNKVIESNKLFSITLPNTITDGTYSIIIMPNDTLLYNKTQSQPFFITTTNVEIFDKDKNPNIKIIGNTIVCNCQTPYETYNIVGQRMQNNTELPIGMYIVKCNNIVQKVIIKP